MCLAGCLVVPGLEKFCSVFQSFLKYFNYLGRSFQILIIPTETI